MVLSSSGSHGPLSGPLGFQNVSMYRPPLADIHSASSANQAARYWGRGLLVSQMSISGASWPLSSRQVSSMSSSRANSLALLMPPFHQLRNWPPPKS
jgi:hypothetical protein